MLGGLLGMHPILWRTLQLRRDLPGLQLINNLLRPLLGKHLLLALLLLLLPIPQLEIISVHDRISSAVFNKRLGQEGDAVMRHRCLNLHIGLDECTRVAACCLVFYVTKDCFDFFEPFPNRIFSCIHHHLRNVSRSSKLR